MTFIAIGEKRELRSDNFLELMQLIEEAPDDEGFSVYRVKDDVVTVLGPDGFFREV